MNVEELVSQEFTTTLNKFIDLVSSKFDIKKTVLISILNDKTTFKEKKHKEPKQPVVSSNNKCKALLKSGNRKGLECGKKVSSKSETENYCGSHLKFESLPEEKGKERGVESSPIFRLNNHGNFAYGETGLILKSKDEKIIIGKQLNGKKIEDLTEDDIKICKLNKFKYIENYSKNGNSPRQ